MQVILYKTYLLAKTVLTNLLDQLTLIDNFQINWNLKRDIDVCGLSESILYNTSFLRIYESQQLTPVANKYYILH